MTRDEYLAHLWQMTPRELDAEIAEKIFEYTWEILDDDTVLCEPESDANYFRTYWPNRNQKYLDPKLDMLPYSIDIAAAWEVFVKFYYPCVWRDGDTWACKLRLNIDDNPVIEYASTAPRAICLAACLACWEGEP